MQKTGRAAEIWANVAPLRWLLCPGTGPTLRERLLRAEMPGRGLLGPASRASPPPCSLFLLATGNRLSSLSRRFPGKRSLPLRSPPPGCRKEVTGTFPLLCLLGLPVTKSRATQKFGSTALSISNKQNPTCSQTSLKQAPPDSARFLPPRHAPNPTVSSLRPNTLQFSHKNCRHTHVHM